LEVATGANGGNAVSTSVPVPAQAVPTYSTRNEPEATKKRFTWSWRSAAWLIPVIVVALAMVILAILKIKSNAAEKEKEKALRIQAVKEARAKRAEEEKRKSVYRSEPAPLACAPVAENQIVKSQKPKVTVPRLEEIKSLPPLEDSSDSSNEQKPGEEASRDGLLLEQPAAFTLESEKI
jgi:hypothetical protein